MIAFDKDELIGHYESLADNDERISGINEQKKMINADSKARIDEFAKEKEVSPSSLKKGYTHYKECIAEDSIDEDVYTLMAMVDESLTNGNNDSED